MPDQNNDPLSGAEQQAQNQIDQGIDDVAGKIPGGDQFSQQAKDAVSGGLGNLEQEAEGKLGNLGGLGGMLGGNSGNQ